MSPLARPARHASLYQLNTRAVLHDLGTQLGRPATLDDIPDISLDRVGQDGFDWLWPLGVWQTGDAGRQVSLHQPDWQREYRELLPDFTSDDVVGSPFAICDYAVHRNFGGPQALAQVRKRLQARGVRLMLDFVPNHTALDHPWVHDHPEFYVHGSEEDLAREPQNYRRVDTRHGPRVLAHGRDPYFPGWPDTLQVNYRHRGFREAMLQVLQSVASQCDGVRCDMAMLLLPEVIARTWGDRALPADGSAPVDNPFWAEAIGRTRDRYPGFVFMAEAYWDLEWTLQQQGFDYTYDKRLYDCLHRQDAGAVRGHLLADPDFQAKSVRFLENHDEPRAASAFPFAVHRAAATIAFLVPGLRFIHEGQRSGRRLRASNHLRRRASEPVDRDQESFYNRLFACMHRPEVRTGDWRLLEQRPAWGGNPTWDRFVAFSWESAGQRLLVTVNYGPTQGQCHVGLAFGDLAGRTWLLRDLLNPTVKYERDGNELAQRGLYLDLPAWGRHVFEVTPLG
jgi:Alpha amylase, catalytic domain